MPVLQPVPNPMLHDTTSALIWHVRTKPAPGELTKGEMEDIVFAKIHRARLTHVIGGVQRPLPPCVVVDRKWLDEVALRENDQVQVVNACNGRRDELFY